MNFQTMEYFTAVVEKRSFTRAAESLHITQQTLSAHIANLEKELGCALLIRHIPLELTYAGEVFFRYAADFNQKYASMMHEFDDILENQQGKLRIGVAYTRGRGIMPGLIYHFQKSYPKVEIELVEGTNEEMHRNLADGKIDLAIANFPVQLPGIQIEAFYDEEMVIVVSEELLRSIYGEEMESVLKDLNENQNLSLLKSCPFLIDTDEQLDGRNGRMFLRRAGFQPIVKARSENSETLLELCVLGIGAYFVSRNRAEFVLTGEQLKGLRFISLGEDAWYTIHFAWLEQAYQWKMISRFVEMSKEFTSKNYSNNTVKYIKKNS